MLDLPEPWRVVKHAIEALRPGGILVAYLPTILQVGRLREELAGAPFGMVETLEVLQRTWHVEGQSIRPDHRMVAHTGFLTHARLLARDLSGRERARSRDHRGLGSWLPSEAGASASSRGSSRGAASAIGLVIGVRYVPRVVTAFGGTSADDRVTVAVLFLVLVATLGQALGLALGVVVHRYSRRRAPAADAGTDSQVPRSARSVCWRSSG